MAQTGRVASGQESFPEGYSTVCPGHRPRAHTYLFSFPVALKEPLPVPVTWTPDGDSCLWADAGHDSTHLIFFLLS